MKIDTTIIDTDTMDFLATQVMDFMSSKEPSDEGIEEMRTMLHGHIHEITKEEVLVLLIEQEVQRVVASKMLLKLLS